MCRKKVPVKEWWECVIERDRERDREREREREWDREREESYKGLQTDGHESV